MEEDMETHLEVAMQGLSPEKVRQVIDFASYLRSKYVPDAPQRGSAAAILQALEEVGPLQFEPGELDSLLDDIQMTFVDDITLENWRV
jgi:hypothetical protein